MKAPDIPFNEPGRQAALCALEVLDTPAEARFDRITRIAQRHFGVQIALVSLVDAGRQWFKSKQGLDATETPRDISFCGHAVLSEDVLYVPNALDDPRFADNPLVTGAPNIRFYAGAPLHAPGGERIGTLCIIDDKPRELSAGDFAVLRDLADAVEAELERTHLLQAQAELRSNRERLQHLVDLSPGVIYACKAFGDFGATYISEQVVRVLGYQPRSFIENPSFWRDRVHPEDRERVLGELKVLFDTGEHTHEYRFLHADGGYRWMHDRLHLVRDAQGDPLEFVGIWMDISERKRDEQQLRSAENRLRAVIDTVVDGIVTIDDRGLVSTFNPAAEHIFGYAAAEVVGRNVSMLMPEPYHSAHDGYLHNYLSTGNRKVIGIGREVTGQRKDGSTFPMDLAVSEMEINGERMFTGIVRDITERKKVERMKSEFVSTVSHELRTPLTSIRGALSLLMGKHGSALPEKGRQLLEMANRNSERLTLLINDILDLEKIESGSLDFNFGKLDLAALAQQALAANEGYAQQHGVRLRLAEAPPAAAVRGDEHRLLQVFANLLSNAIKYSPSEGEVVVSVSRRDGRYRVSVKDRGRGIPPEFRSRMFQRFAQADSSDTREKGGTGLGLSVTKAIIERHDGTIDYVSEAGAGTDFFFELPAWEETVTGVHGKSGEPLLLVCEDNSDVARVLSELLAREGLASDIAATAAGAKSLLAERRYQALLLDLSLPDQDGLELIRELRAQEHTRDLPIIVVSGRASEGRAAWEGDALAVIDWLQKPVDEARLARAIRQALVGYAQPRILHVEDDLDVVQVTRALVDGSVEYAYATTLAEARRRLLNERFDLVLLDLMLPDGSGLELLEELKGRVPVVVFSGQEPDRALAEQVAAALVKTRTSNEQLLETIKRTIHRKGT